jgi:beta-phosphoglucomutase-like phosphatase (HAD superfamily)
MIDKIIAFDVDGVLIDSEKEVLITSWNEYNLWKKDKGLPYQEFTVSYQDIPNTFIQTYTAFRC